MSDAPLSHITQALDLSADAKCDLFELALTGTAKGTTVRFWNGPTYTWQDNEYQGLACQLQGEGARSDGSYVRPKLVVMNPDNIFGPFAADAYFDLAVLTRKRLLAADLKANANIFEQAIWIVGRVAGVTKQSITLELRNTTDMPNWTTPRRSYNPPDYPFVQIQ